MIELGLHLQSHTTTNWKQKFQRISKMIDGFSGREIVKPAFAWQVSSNVVAAFSIVC